MGINPIKPDELDDLLGDITYEITPTIDYSVKGEVNEDGVPVIIIKGRVLGVGAGSLVDTVARRYEDLDADLILDMTDCSFMASVALGFVATLAEFLAKNNRKLYVLNPNDQSKKMIVMLGFSDVLFIDGDVSAE